MWPISLIDHENFVASSSCPSWLSSSSRLPSASHCTKSHTFLCKTQVLGRAPLVFAFIHHQLAISEDQLGLLLEFPSPYGLSTLQRKLWLLGLLHHFNLHYEHLVPRPELQFNTKNKAENPWIQRVFTALSHFLITMRRTFVSQTLTFLQPSPTLPRWNKKTLRPQKRSHYGHACAHSEPIESFHCAKET